jgi:hypothetical protein
MRLIQLKEAKKCLRKQGENLIKSYSLAYFGIKYFLIKARYELCHH